MNMGQRWSDTDRGNRTKDSKEACPSTTLFATNSTWTAVAANPGLDGEKPVTDDTAQDNGYNKASDFGQNGNTVLSLNASWFHKHEH
jgi:hypothetical protein